MGREEICLFCLVKEGQTSSLFLNHNNKSEGVIVFFYLGWNFLQKTKILQRQNCSFLLNYNHNLWNVPESTFYKYVLQHNVKFIISIEEE